MRAWCIFLAALGSAWGASLEQIIEGFGQAHVGVSVETLDGRVVYEKNADQFFTPASALKVWSCLAALATPEAAHGWSTAVWHPGIPYAADCVVLQFSGDPSLTSKDLEQLFVEVRRKTTRSALRIFVDVGELPWPPITHPHAMLEDLDSCDLVPLGGIVIDGNYFHCSLNPSADGVGPAHFHSDLALPYSIENHTHSVPAAANQRRTYFFHNGKVFVEGDIGRPQAIELPVRDMEAFVRSSIIRACQASGCGCKALLFRPLEKHWLLAIHYTPLLACLQTACKNSDNTFFGALHLLLPKAIIEVLEDRYGISLGDCKVFDGTGLSRCNLITPKQMVHLLREAYPCAAFRSTLAVNGVDGTLQERLVEFPWRGRIQAKTGSMRGISALAGYLTTADNHIFIFTIFVNNGPYPLRQYKRLEDSFCKALILNKNPPL